MFFWYRGNSNLDSLACSALDSEFSEIQPGPSRSVFLYPGYQQFLKPKIPLALKVLQVFPGKIIG